MTPGELLTDEFERIHDLVDAVVDDSPSIRPTDARTAPATRSPGCSGTPPASRTTTSPASPARSSRGRPGGAGSRCRWTTGTTGTGTPRRRSTACAIEDLALLVGYQDAVHEQTIAYLRGVDEAELDRVVDTRWDPPVTAGVRLVSIVGDCLQHLGQAGYVKGLS